jgi:hypothetical protein
MSINTKVKKNKNSKLKKMEATNHENQINEIYERSNTTRIKISTHA